MLPIRENSHVLRIFAADRQAADHGKKSCFLIPAVDTYRILSRIGAVNILLIPGHTHRAGCRKIARIFVEVVEIVWIFSRLRELCPRLISKYINYIFKLVHQIKEASVPAEPEMSGRRFQVAADGVYLNHLLFLIIKAVNLYLIHSVIHTEDVFIVRHPAGACHVRAEITLCHASVSFIIYTVHDPPTEPSLFKLRIVVFPS